jgi:hypothetical protein
MMVTRRSNWTALLFVSALLSAAQYAQADSPNPQGDRWKKVAWGHAQLLANEQQAFDELRQWEQETRRKLNQLDALTQRIGQPGDDVDWARTYAPDQRQSDRQRLEIDRADLQRSIISYSGLAFRSRAEVEAELGRVRRLIPLQQELLGKIEACGRGIVDCWESRGAVKHCHDQGGGDGCLEIPKQVCDNGYDGTWCAYHPAYFAPADTMVEAYIRDLNGFNRNYLSRDPRTAREAEENRQRGRALYEQWERQLARHKDVICQRYCVEIEGAAGGNRVGGGSSWCECQAAAAHLPSGPSGRPGTVPD